MAGTVTQVSNKLGIMKTIVLTCTADASDASFPETALTEKIDGFLLAMESNPGGTAPTANYDITLEDGDGLDVLGGAGANRHTSTSEMAGLPFGTYFHWPVSPEQTYTLKITNNSNNSAITVVTLFYSAQSG